MVRQALAADPEIVEGHMLLGNFLRKAAATTEAIAAYRRALALDPEHDESVFRLALTYKDMGRLAEARVGFERARELDPRNGKVLWQLADLDDARGRFDRRREAILEDALARKVEEPRFLLKLGECHIEAKRYDEAEAGARARPWPQRPGLETAHFNLGLVLRGAGRDPAAMAAYEAELAGNPKAYRASFNLAKLLLKGGRPARPPTASARPWPSRRSSGPAISTWPRRCSTWATSMAPNARPREGLRVKADPEIAPLGPLRARRRATTGAGAPARRSRRKPRRAGSRTRRAAPTIDEEET